MSIPDAFVTTDPEAMLLPSGQTLLVPKAVATFKLWTKETPFDRYGNKAVLDYCEDPMFAEFVILRMFEKDGWRGVWADSYRDKYWERINESADLPENVRAKLDHIQGFAGCRGGCFDVVLWRGDQMLFVESKRARKDRIRDSQLRWIEAATTVGLSLDSFLIVEWDAI